ncbi:MAG: trypsin-like serine peptidase [Pseudonocardiaceae bacterium]
MSGERVVAEVRRIFGDPGELAERLTATGFDELLESLVEGQPADPVAEAVRLERDRVVSDGIDGLAKVAEGREDELDDAELLGLEAIVLLEGRPAILIQEGDFLPPPHEWARLTGARAGIREVIARSGRVEVTGHRDYEWVGTASLIAPAAVMTNRHVAREFCSRAGGDWVFRPGMTSRIDFLKELGSTASMEFEITGVIGVHEDRDLALLRVAGASSDGRPLPNPLAVSAQQPADVYGREVYVVGYPAWDGRRSEPEPLRRIFMDVYNVKRLQPGRAVKYSTEFSALQHDCSTLGGNSGSPVVDLETHQVIGLHFGGRYGVGNYAVPLWMLTGDPLLAKGGVNFQ